MQELGLVKLALRTAEAIVTMQAFFGLFTHSCMTSLTSTKDICVGLETVFVLGLGQTDSTPQGRIQDFFEGGRWVQI